MKKFLVGVLLLCFLSLSIVGCGDKKLLMASNMTLMGC